MKTKTTPIRIHPNLLHHLQKVYIAKSKIVNNTEKSEEDLTKVFEEINFYANGQGQTVLNKLNELFQLEKVNIFKEHSNINQLVNTSLQDATYLTSVVELRSLLKEIKDIVVCLENKKNTFKEDELKVTRGLKIDIRIHSFFQSYIDSLLGFETKINNTIKSLESNLPLSSSVKTINSELESFLTNNNIQQNDEKLFNELKYIYSLNSEFNAKNNRVEKITDTMPIRETASLTNELATVLFKFANDIRFLSSGPRSGFGEMSIPENEPGSSIMPGKVNPTQCESLTMICSQVLGNSNAIMISSSVSTFEGNTFLPLISNNIVRSLVLLTDGIRSFRTKCMEGADFIKEKLVEELKDFKI